VTTGGPRDAGVLVVIPARGGSKGVPRKNLRSLRGRPLISYAIATARASRFRPDVVVSSEDGEILAIARKLGAETHQREPGLADDATTLDEVVADALRARSVGRSYDLVATVQPTSPLLATSSLDRAIELMVLHPEIDTVVSARESHHLTWRRDGDRFVPNYAERLNRQYLPATYTETGGVLVTRPRIIEERGTRVGDRVELLVVSAPEAIDIDRVEDFWLCERYLGRRNVLFVVTGYDAVGLGHVYNALTIANEMHQHDVSFLVDRDSDLAYQVLSGHHYTVQRQRSDSLVEDVRQLGADVVINDLLDTSPEYVQGLKAIGATVINFEDLGEGARHADLVVNAIYPERQILPNHYFGHRYFAGRNEFLMTQPREIAELVSRVLITFGGTDPNDYTGKVLRAIGPECRRREIRIDVVLGTGYDAGRKIAADDGVTVVRGVANLSDYIRSADIVFTSAGRTIFEIAIIGTPAIVMAQNDREATHLFASGEHGFENLGMGTQVSEEEIATAFTNLVDSPQARRYMNQLMLDSDLRSGRDRVLKLIEETIESV
jgi:CMP-N-acetylneuraminic acid synthetase